MSTDYDLVCLGCNETLECAASGSIAYGNKLWDTEPEGKLITFLLKHKNHRLVFIDEHTEFQDIVRDEACNKSDGCYP